MNHGGALPPVETTTNMMVKWSQQIPLHTAFEGTVACAGSCASAFPGYCWEEGTAAVSQEYSVELVDPMSKFTEGSSLMQIGPQEETTCMVSRTCDHHARNPLDVSCSPTTDKKGSACCDAALVGLVQLQIVDEVWS